MPLRSARSAVGPQVDLKEEGARLDFLGFTFRYERDRFGRSRRYLNVEPSRQAVQRERDKLRAMTRRRFCWQPLPDLVADLNRHLKGWANYFDFGYPRRAFRRINGYVRARMAAHLKRRSQRAFRLPEGLTSYRYLADLGLVLL